MEWFTAAEARDDEEDSADEVRRMDGCWGRWRDEEMSSVSGGRRVKRQQEDENRNKRLINTRKWLTNGIWRPTLYKHSLACISYCHPPSLSPLSVSISLDICELSVCLLTCIAMRASCMNACFYLSVRISKEKLMKPARKNQSISEWTNQMTLKVNG